METKVTYYVGHDSQVPQVVAVVVFEKVVETVRTAVGAGVPGRGVPDTAEKGVGEGGGESGGDNGWEGSAGTNFGGEISCEPLCRLSFSSFTFCLFFFSCFRWSEDIHEGSLRLF